VPPTATHPPAARSRPGRASASEALLDANPAAVRALAAEHGTPLLLLSTQVARRQYRALAHALPEVDVHYSMKPLPHPAVVQGLRDEGAGFDLASAGEVDLARVLDVDPDRCIHTHPIKRDRDISHALDFGCRTFVFDNPYELAKLEPYKREVDLLLRISFPNPQAQCDLSLKYGVAAGEALWLLGEAADAGFAVRGLSFHVGSQVADPARFLAAIAACRGLFDLAEVDGMALDTLDIGGGFPVPYVEPVSGIADFCAPIAAALREQFPHARLIAEPGRFVSAPAMTLVSSVIGKAERQGGVWYYLDDGLYGSYSGRLFDRADYRLIPLVDLEGAARPKRHSVVAGPTCDSIDVICEDRLLTEMECDDLVVSPMMGAYTAASATDFHLLRRAKVVELASGEAAIARSSASGRSDARGAACAAVRLLGAETEVPCSDGRRRRYVNLDYAASTPALPQVWRAVEAFMPWYSSVHRGTGKKSQVATEAFETTRDVVAAFLGARSADHVVFVRNTTEAINVLAAALPEGARVLSTPVEHHANLLPWRRHDVQMLPFPGSADDLCESCDHALATARTPINLVAVTGASNVTGEVWPLARLADIAHRHGAQLFVDAAQLAPHRPIDMARMGIDLLAFSGHKLYAPFGAGALVGDFSRLAPTAPLVRGGGAIRYVTLDDAIWAYGPERYEAGSPNVVGVVALGAACRALGALGMDAVGQHERLLAARLRTGLHEVPGLEMLTLWLGEDVDRVGVAAFMLAGYRDPHLAAILSAEHAVGVRHGCFCAHPLMTHLLGVTDDEAHRLRAELEAGGRPAMPGAVRASIGLGTTPEDIDRLTSALDHIVRHGPATRYRYASEHDEYQPVELFGHEGP